MKAIITWIESRTGLGTAAGHCIHQRVEGGAGLRFVLPALLAFGFVVQAITGFFLWMVYSASAQTAWESVYYIQHELLGGWLLRGLHHYTAQVMVALAGIYLLQLLITRAYRAPREVIFWLAVLILLTTLGLCLTGDLLRWDQRGYWSTTVRTSFLNLVPVIGGDLFQLAVGGPAFGHHTVTRFLSLHIGLCGATLAVLLVLHGSLLRRHGLATGGSAENKSPKTSLAWPDQAWRNMAACLVMLVVVGLLIAQHALTGDHPGERLSDTMGAAHGAPADPADADATARPEWSFLGLYQMAHLFEGGPMVIPIFVIPGLLFAAVMGMPFIAQWKHGHSVNLAVAGVLVVGLVVLSAMAINADANNEDHQIALAEKQAEARRVKEVIRARGGIPGEGGLSLMYTDPKIAGPRLGKQHCANCHAYTPREGEGPLLTLDEPVAPELYGFASREWIAGLLDPEQIATAKYFGGTRLAQGLMADYVRDEFAKLDEQKRKAIIAALSAEAQLESQAAADRDDAALIEEGRELLVGECISCHRYGDAGVLGDAPDLTGYGSRQWLFGIIKDPTHERFYGNRNDRMPAYAKSIEKPAENLLSAQQVGIVADWLRGEWIRPVDDPSQPIWQPPRTDAETIASLRWEQTDGAKPAIDPDAPHAEARLLFEQYSCSSCHYSTGGDGSDIVVGASSAPDLGGFATRRWLAGIVDPEQIASEKYFGNTAFRRGKMVKEIERLFEDEGENEEDLEILQEDLEMIVAALSAEAQLPTQREMDEEDEDLIADGRDLLGDYCGDCHLFGGKGTASGPELTGYGSREWLTGIICNPTHNRFYGKDNDRMPAYAASAESPETNRLTPRQIELLSAWLRGE